MELIKLKPEQIVPSADNPRKDFNPDRQTELNLSIQEKGILDEITVSPLNGNGKYEIIDGERRYRAAIVLGLEEIPCKIRTTTEEEARELRLVSALQRANLHPLEEARAFSDYIKSGKCAAGSTAKKIGIPESHIAQRLKLLDLIPAASKAYEKGTLTIEHATLLAKMTPEDQNRAIEFLIEDDPLYGLDIARDVKVFKEWISEEISLNLSVAPFDKADQTLIPGVPACLECPKNSGFNTALFPELNAKHICGDRICFKAKVAAHLEREKKRIRKEEKRPFIMISSKSLAMDDPLKVDGLKMEGRYKIVKAGKECEDTKRAQWIDGPNKGKFVLVCNYSKCKKHWGGAGRSTAAGSGTYDDPKQVAKRQKAEKDQEFNTAVAARAWTSIMSATLDKMTGKFDPECWKLLAKKFWYMSEYEVDEDIFNKLAGSPIHPIGKKIDSMSQKDLERLTIIFLMLHESYESEFETVETLAKHHKIDILKYFASVKEELHRCEVCGCSEITACTGGCSWDPTFLGDNRYICSNCPDEAKPIAASKTASKRKKSAAA